jgi:DNA-binding response OmpR family regulator
VRALTQHHRRLVTHRELLREVWDPEYRDETHYLRVHVAHIRSKLDPDPSQPRYLIPSRVWATSCAIPRLSAIGRGPVWI